MGSTKHGGHRIRPGIIDEIHDEWCKANGYPIRKQTRTSSGSTYKQARQTSKHQTNKQANRES